MENQITSLFCECTLGFMCYLTVNSAFNFIRIAKSGHVLHTRPLIACQANLGEGWTSNCSHKRTLTFQRYSHFERILFFKPNPLKLLRAGARHRSVTDSDFPSAYARALPSSLHKSSLFFCQAPCGVEAGDDVKTATGWAQRSLPPNSGRPAGPFLCLYVFGLHLKDCVLLFVCNHEFTFAWK